MTEYKCIWKDILEESLKKYSTSTGNLKRAFYPWNDACVNCNGDKMTCAGYLSAHMLKDDNQLHLFGDE